MNKLYRQLGLTFLQLWCPLTSSKKHNSPDQSTNLPVSVELCRKWRFWIESCRALERSTIHCWLMDHQRIEFLGFTTGCVPRSIMNGNFGWFEPLKMIFSLETRTQGTHDIYHVGCCSVFSTASPQDQIPQRTTHHRWIASNFQRHSNGFLRSGRIATIIDTIMTHFSRPPTIGHLLETVTDRRPNSSETYNRFLRDKIKSVHCPLLALPVRMQCVSLPSAYFPFISPCYWLFSSFEPIGSIRLELTDQFLRQARIEINPLWIIDSKRGDTKIFPDEHWKCLITVTNSQTTVCMPGISHWPTQLFPISVHVFVCFCSLCSPSSHRLS